MSLSAIKTKIETLETDSLKEMAKSLSSDYRDGVDIVYSEVLNALELRMSESEFVNFCNAI